MSTPNPRLGSWLTDHVADRPEERTWWRAWGLVVFALMLLQVCAMHDLASQRDAAKAQARTEYIRGWDDARQCMEVPPGGEAYLAAEGAACMRMHQAAYEARRRR